MRRIWERSGGICEFGGCEQPATELCHVVDHRGWRDGRPSGRETHDLVHGCHMHHSLFDDDAVAFVCWSSDTPSENGGRHRPDGRPAGRPVFRNTRTNELMLPKPWPEEREKEASGEWLLCAVGRWDTKAARAERRRQRQRAAEEAEPLPPAAEAPPRKPEAPDGTGLVHDRGPPCDDNVLFAYRAAHERLVRRSA